MTEAAEVRGVLRLGDILVDRGVISEEQLEESLFYQKETGARLGESVVALGYATADQVAEALAWQRRYGLSVLREIDPDPGIVGLLSEKFCRVRQVLPIRFNGRGTLLLAMVDTGDIDTIDDVRLITGTEISPVPVSWQGFEEAVQTLFTQTRRLVTSLTAEPDLARSRARDLEEYTRVIVMVDDIISTAVRRGASDMHFEPRAGCVALRIRVGGVLHHLTDLPSEAKDAVVSRIKNLGKMDAAEKRLPQEGRVTIEFEGEPVDLCITTVPSVFGENVIIRIVDERTQELGLKGLGLDGAELASLREALRNPQGLVLIAGPAGSGKSTTLYAGLEELNRPGVKIYTVEDPVEKVVSGVVQAQIQPNLGLDFASMLRLLVRCDPDVIMVGELRDKETALGAAEAAMAGHLILSTLPAEDAPSSISRLGELGLSSDLVSSSLVCVVAQRLARRLCPHCKQLVSLAPESMTEWERELLGPTEAVIARGVGCKKCLNSGYRGRIGLFEVLPVDPGLRELIASRATTAQVREHALHQGMRSLREDGRQKVLACVTTADEVERLVV